jgi:hypothetical protein
MSTYIYKPYYDYNGPTKSEPFRARKSADEQTQCFGNFHKELEHHFSDVEHEIRWSGRGEVSIAVAISEEECDARVKVCLNDNDLYAHKIRG